MVKVAIKVNNTYHVVLASGSDTPYQILTHERIDPDTRKVFVNGTKITAEKINTPLSAFGTQTVYLSVKY